MELIVINKKSIGLNKASCTCGWYKFSTTGGEIDRLGSEHGRTHSDSRTTHTIDGQAVSLSGRRAQPGRPAGGPNYASAGGSGDANPNLRSE